MGTINYATSNYITIGLKPYDYEDFEDENGNIDYDMMNEYYLCLADRLLSTLKNCVMAVGVPATR